VLQIVSIGLRSPLTTFISVISWYIRNKTRQYTYFFASLTCTDSSRLSTRYVTYYAQMSISQHTISNSKHTISWSKTTLRVRNVLAASEIILITSLGWTRSSTLPRVSANPDPAILATTSEKTVKTDKHESLNPKTASLFETQGMNSTQCPANANSSESMLSMPPAELPV
jgi:hypothetical protein